MYTPDANWQRFIAHLNIIDPLVFHSKDGDYTGEHTSFLGAIKHYRKIFLDANKIDNVMNPSNTHLLLDAKVTIPTIYPPAEQP